MWRSFRLVAMGLKPKIQITLAGLLVGFCSYVAYDIAQELKQLRKTNVVLESSVKEKDRQLRNSNLVCDGMADPSGQILYLDCGESFAPRYATCACTLWCLEDYQFTVSNRNQEDCNKE